MSTHYSLCCNSDITDTDVMLLKGGFMDPRRKSDEWGRAYHRIHGRLYTENEYHQAIREGKDTHTLPMSKDRTCFELGDDYDETPYLARVLKILLPKTNWHITPFLVTWVRFYLTDRERVLDIFPDWDFQFGESESILSFLETNMNKRAVVMN